MPQHTFVTITLRGFDGAALAREHGLTTLPAVRTFVDGTRRATLDGVTPRSLTFFVASLRAADDMRTQQEVRTSEPSASGGGFDELKPAHDMRAPSLMPDDGRRKRRF